MCLYPRLVDNPKYKANKKNGGVIPPKLDPRVSYVPIGCQTCWECRRKKAREWQARLQEEIRHNRRCYFITLTFSTESLNEIVNNNAKLQELDGYDLDNGITVKALELFLDRWRKRHKQSLKHWLVTELGHGDTEHIHMHGLLWTEHITTLEEIWGYGKTHIGSYLNARTVNYIIKYVSKADHVHLNYKQQVYTSNGIGKQYTTRNDAKSNKFKKGETNEAYRTSTGHKVALPIYWRNKIYTEEERERLWIEKLDKNTRWVCGEKIDITENQDAYYNVLEYHRRRTRNLGYPDPDMIWSKKAYEEQRRKMIHEKRITVLKKDYE